MTDCLFCKIIAKQIPAEVVYEDENVLAFLDITPVNPGHVLVIPKQHCEGFLDADLEVLTHWIQAAQKIARALVKAGICDDFNLGQNNGKLAGQVIPHLHLHIMPRTATDGYQHWHGRPYVEGESGEVAQRIRAQL